MTEIRADLKLHPGERSLGEGGHDDEYVLDAFGAWVWKGDSVAYLAAEDRSDIDEDGIPAEVAADLRMINKTIPTSRVKPKAVRT